MPEDPPFDDTIDERCSVIVTLRQFLGGSIRRCAALAVSILMVTTHHPIAATVSADGKPAASLNGPFLLLIPSANAPNDTLAVASPGQHQSVLLRTLPAETTLALSPHGRYIALGEGVRGLWLVDSDGTHLRRRLLAPVAVPPRSSGQGGARPAASGLPSPDGTSARLNTSRLAVGAVAWSPDRYTLAYTLQTSAQAAGGDDPHIGIWLVRYDQGRSRELIAAQHFNPASGFGGLSWSHDGRTVLTTIAGRLVAIDAATGHVHVLPLPTRQGQTITASAFSPVAATLFYLVDNGLGSHPAYTLFVTDAQGCRARALVNVDNIIESPVWAPDGQSIAYVWQRLRDVGPQGSASNGEVHVVALASGRVQTILLPPLTIGVYGRPLIAWLHIRE